MQLAESPDLADLHTRNHLIKEIGRVLKKQRELAFGFGFEYSMVCFVSSGSLIDY